MDNRQRAVEPVMTSPAALAVHCQRASDLLCTDRPEAESARLRSGGFVPVVSAPIEGGTLLPGDGLSVSLSHRTLVVSDTSD